METKHAKSSLFDGNQKYLKIEYINYLINFKVIKLINYKF